jgi:hypothetical protein
LEKKPGRATGPLAALIVALSAGTVLLASAQRRPATATAAPASVASAAALGLPGPLPSGAQARPNEELLSFDGCSFPDRGFGEYEAWRTLPVGRALVPRDGAVDGADGGFNLLLHFHGAEPVRKQLVLEDTDLVIVGVDAGTLSSHYTRVLSAEGSFAALITSIEREVAVATRRTEAHARHITVSSWSAGYGAVAQILARPDARRLDGVILLDSLHGGYARGPGSRAADHRVDPTSLQPFLSFAREAATGGPLFYLTHSAVATDGYASTTDVASMVLEEVGAPAHDVTPNPGDALRLTRMSDDGRFFVRGYAGGSKEDHCAQLRLLPSIVRERVLRK